MFFYIGGNYSTILSGSGNHIDPKSNNALILGGNSNLISGNFPRNLRSED